MADNRYDEVPADDRARAHIIVKAFEVFTVLNECVERYEKIESRIWPLALLFSVINPLFVMAVWFRTEQSWVVIVMASIWLVFSVAEIFFKKKEWVSDIPLVCQFFIEIFAGSECPNRGEMLVQFIALVAGVGEVHNGHTLLVRSLLLISTYFATLSRYHDERMPTGLMRIFGLSPLLLSSYITFRSYLRLLVIFVFAIHSLVLYVLNNRATLSAWVQTCYSRMNVKELTMELYYQMIHRAFQIFAEYENFIFLPTAQVILLHYSLYFIAISPNAYERRKLMVLRFLLLYISIHLFVLWQ